MALPRARPSVFLDLGLAVALSAVTALTADNLSAFQVLLTVLLVTLPLAARRSWPSQVLVIVAAGVLLTGAHATYVDVVAIAIASFSLGESERDRVRSAFEVLVVAGGLAVILLLERADPLAAATLPFIILVPSWLVGDVLRTRRQQATASLAEAARAQREREARLEAGIAEERRHVARELHDVVAHAVSVMVIQAGAARQVVRSSPERAEEAMLAVEATGREAMTELRHLLGVLGDESEVAGRAPQPGIAQLDDLVGRVRLAGLPVALEVDGERRPVPVGVEITVYRIAQEALTNALRYARHAPTLVHVAYEATQLRLEVLDEGPGVADAAEVTGAAGRGLAGMRERASLLGGRLEAGPRLGGGFAVRAWLPTGSEAS